MVLTPGLTVPLLHRSDLPSELVTSGLASNGHLVQGDVIIQGEFWPQHDRDFLRL